MISALVAGGCNYEFPVQEKPDIPVDKNLLGLWEIITKDKDKAGQKMLVLKFSEKEYLIRYYKGKEAMYFRGYLVKIGKTVFFQDQYLGDAEKPARQKDRKYSLVKYSLKDNILEIAFLNPEAIPEKVSNGEELKKAIETNINRKGLFKDNASFKKVP